MAVCGFSVAAAQAAAPPPAVRAGPADGVGVEVSRSPDGTYAFDVVVRHADEGPEHDAERWDVLAPDGTVLGTRTPLHPHVSERPFTRSLGGRRNPRRRGGAHGPRP